MGKDSLIIQSHTTVNTDSLGWPRASSSTRRKEEKKKISLFPLLGTGNTVIEAVKVLVEHGVQPSVIILLSLFSTPHGKLKPLPSLKRCQIDHPGIPRDHHFNYRSSSCCTNALWTEIFWNRLTHLEQTDITI